MKILAEKVLGRKERVSIKKIKKKMNLGPGDRFKLVITQDMDYSSATNEAEVLPPPSVIDVMQIISLDGDDLKRLGIKDGWACVWGERA
jgi:hypothetical protein